MVQNPESVYYAPIVLYHCILPLCIIPLSGRTNSRWVKGERSAIILVSEGYESKKVTFRHLEDPVTLETNSDDSQYQTRMSVAARSSPYQRIILLIIDALRADFAFGPLNYIPETRKILDHGHGMQFIAEAHPPTVTLPRLKAITTGSTPSFLDVVLNFGSPALEEDNIVTQMKIDGRRIIFFGDDTWMKLFPQHFVRNDGTTSFYVSDYTEVDINVTRHLKTELDKPTWEVMILHYLGLDHIGHLAGPSSPLIRPKLAEMDRVIKQIYSAMELWSEPSLLVVCGDHGMSDQGGHGGASAGEVSVPVLFLSPHFTNQDLKHVGSIKQIDLCPTLSVLMDLPIPKNNLGKVITEVLVDLTTQQKVYVAHHNAHQSIQILEGYVQDLEKESSFLLYKKAHEQFNKWLVARNSTPEAEWEMQGQNLLTIYSESLGLLAEKVGKLATQYDVYAMAIAMMLLWLLLISLVLSHMQKSLPVPSVSVSNCMSLLAVASGSAVLTHITMCTCGVPSNLVCQASTESIAVQLTVGILFVGCLIDMITEWSQCQNLMDQFKTWSSSTKFVEIFLLVGTLAHTFTLLSSSYVEEEHQTFYFLTATVHLLLLSQILVGCLFHQRSKVSLDKERSERKQIYMGEDICKDDLKEDRYSSKDFDNTLTSHRNMEDDLTECEPPGSSASPSSNHRHKPQVLSSYSTQSVNHSDQKESAKKTHIPKGTFENALKAHQIPTAALHFSISLLAVLIILRILRRWNQTGNKWLDIPDFGDWLILPENKHYLSLIVLFSMMILAVSRGQHLKRIQSMCVNLSLSAAYLYRAADGSIYFPSTGFLSSRGISEARAAFIFIGVNFLISFLPNVVFKVDTHKEKKIKSQSSDDNNTALSAVDTKSDDKQADLLPTSSLQKHFAKDVKEDDEEGFSCFDQRLRGVVSAFLCFVCLVMRPHNIPVVVLMSLIEQMMSPVLLHCDLKPTCTLLYCLWMGQAFFFFQGNSNSLSTVDLTAGYTGLQEFMPGVTGCLLILATYSGTIFWFLTYLRIISQQTEEDKKHKQRRFSIVTNGTCATLLFSRTLPLLVYTALASAQRYHLFVWTVFSPKLLYEGVNTVVISACAFLFFVFTQFRRST